MKKYLVIGFAFIFLVTGITLGSLHLMRGDPVLANPPPYDTVVGDFTWSEQFTGTPQHQKTITGFVATTSARVHDLRTLAFHPTTGPVGRGINLVIPQSINGVPVRVVNGGGFFRDTVNADRGNIISVVIPEGVTRIEDAPWSTSASGNANQQARRVGLANQSITSVTLPSTLTYIGNHAFRGNFITNLVLPPNITHIGVGAFAFNQIGGNLTIPATVTQLQGGNGNPVANPPTSTVWASLQVGAFQGNLLTGVTIQGALGNIGENVFRNNNISSVAFGGSTFGTSGGEGVFADNSLTTLTIPSTPFFRIPLRAFENNNLTNVIIPITITTIPEGAFADNSLSNINILPVSVSVIGLDAFAGNNFTALPTIPGAVTALNGFARNPFGTVTIPGHVNSIGAGAFDGSNTTTLNLGTVTTIGNNAFRDNNLATLTIPTTVTSIGLDAFAGNNFTTLPTIPTSVTVLTGFARNPMTTLTVAPHIVTIPANAFLNSNLTSVTILGNPTIGASAFTNNSINNLVLGGTTSIGNFAFRDNALLTLTIPNTVTHLGGEVFRENLLTGLTIGTGISVIANGVFWDNSFVTLTIPSHITNIEANAFRGNTSMTSLVIQGAPVIGADAFNGNTSLASVNLGGTTSIGNYAFRDNALVTLTIPSTVTIIGNSAFRNNALTSVTLQNGLVTISQEAFRDNSLSSVTIPASVITIGGFAFYGNTAIVHAILPTTVLSTGNSIFPSTTRVFTHNIGQPTFWGGLGQPVWNAVTNPTITVNNVGGTVSSLGGWVTSGNGSDNLTGSIPWTTGVTLTITNPSGIADILVNGQTVGNTGGVLTNFSATWSHGGLGNTATLVLSLVGHNLDIEVIRQASSVSLEISNPGAGTAVETNGLALNNLVVGTVRNLTATAAPGWAFVNWQLLTGTGSIGSVNNFQTTFTVGDSNAIIRANFVQTGAVTASVNHVGAGTIRVYEGAVGTDLGGGGPVAINAGQSRTLVVTANAGWQFVNWTVTGGGGNVTNALDTTTVFTFTSGSATIVANFIQQSNISMDINIVGAGTANATGGVLTNLSPGTQRTLIAVAALGWRFTHWELVCDDSSASFLGTVDFPTQSTSPFFMGDVAVRIVAHFEHRIYQITFNPDGGAGGAGGTMSLNHRVGDVLGGIIVPTLGDHNFMGYYLGLQRIFEPDGSPSFTIGWVIDGPVTLVASWLLTVPRLDTPVGMNIAAGSTYLTWTPVTGSQGYQLLIVGRITITRIVPDSYFDLNVPDIRDILAGLQFATIRITALGDGVTNQDSLQSDPFSVDISVVFPQPAAPRDSLLWLIGIIIAMLLMTVVLFSFLRRRPKRVVENVRVVRGGQGPKPAG